MCWPFAIALPCAVNQGSQHNELYQLADSLPRLIGRVVLLTLMGIDGLPLRTRRTRANLNRDKWFELWIAFESLSGPWRRTEPPRTENRQSTLVHGDAW